MMIKIEEASIKDIDEIAKVHVDSWKSAYKDILPGRVLEERTYEVQKNKWLKRIFQNNKTNEFMLVAKDDSGEITGFATGSIDDPNNEHDSILFCLYISDKFQKKGIGKCLVNEVKERLKNQGADDMVLWAYRDNTACRFYEHIGGIKEKEVFDNIGGREIAEVSYVFKLNK